MASSYDNNLRLDELATGDGSGTWGTTTNTNLTLIADALGFQSKTVASASTDTLTIPNGTETDNEAISLYVKLTGGNQACTITVGPPTVKKLWIIENATSQVITLTQGSGANVILVAGVTKMIYADGAGSGAALKDALVGLEVGTTLFIKNAGTGDDSTAQLFLQTAEADIAANDILGKINFQAPNEGEGTDAILVAAAIQAKSEGDFSASSNATSLEFMTGASEAAATKMTLSSAGDLTLTSTTASSSSTTGAVKIGGGLGVAADLFVGDDLDVTGAVVIDETALVTGVLTTTATQVATGGITSGSNIVSDTDSTDDLGTTGARWANLFVDAITATDQITATGFTGTLDGILGSGTAAAATVTTLNTSGAVNLNLTTDSTSSTSGALIVDGGVGVAKKLFVGTDLDVDGTTNLDVVDIDGALTQDGGAVFNEASADVDFRVESNGNANMLFVDGGEDAVGIGNNNPGDFGSLTDNLVVGTTSGNNGMTIASGTDGGGRIGFSDTTNDRGMIEYDHNDDKFIFYTAAAARATITSGGDIDVETGDIFFSTAGKGIVLGATSNTAANTLDDYEEGTWTPSLGGNTSYNARSGTYTKIGNKVTVWANIAINAIGTGSARDVSGLPFTTLNIATFNVNGNGVGYYTNLATSVSGLFAIPTKNATTIKFTRIPAGGSITMSHNDFDVYKGSADTYFNFTYATA